MIRENAPNVGRTEFLGVPAVRLENEALAATIVPDWGSRIVSLRSREAGAELLRAPASLGEYWRTPLLYGVPVLFPPNRIEDGIFSYNGRAYRFAVNDLATGNHAHGLVHDNRWEIVSLRREGDVASLITEFVSVRHPEVMAQFPHPFRLVMKLELKGAVLLQQLEIRNESDAAFPWGLGYHTAFRFPFGERSELRSCSLQAPVGRKWELNGRMLPTGELVDDARSEPLRLGMPMDGVLLDDLFEAREGGPNEAVLTDREAGIRLTYRADESFRHWVLHNGDGRGRYLCPEPYTCATNAFNLPLEPAATGLQELRPGETGRLTCEMAVSLLSKEE
ncbi:aldose 1-epimerase [Cohnella zeiphila]|uniref:Aldose 1-epimerase n=1 Tax=Cohnella zeiphila TaxID=2761120 RepID=A0A7X0VUT0_9BACL|nr:aldose 1-epimerase [Cohnella zeiphila]MBB6730735.1 aldose 1-epimerase [Cohnella zeiphila]